MNLKEFRELNCFDTPENVTIDRLYVKDVIAQMRVFADNIIQAYDRSEQLGTTSLDGKFIFDGIKSNLNDYVQAFLDIVAALISMDVAGRKVTSLSQAIRYYTSSREGISVDCLKWIEYLQRRNELMHEYYNYEFMNYELRSTLQNYGDCVKELVNMLEEDVKNAGCSKLRVNRK